MPKAKIRLINVTRPPDDFYPLAEAARLLCIPPATLRWQARRGVVRAVRVGNGVRAPIYVEVKRE